MKALLMGTDTLLPYAAIENSTHSGISLQKYFFTRVTVY